MLGMLKEIGRVLSGEYGRDVANLAWYRKTYRERVGYAQGWGNYKLLSVDGGQHWYSNREGVLEPADEGLLEHLRAIEAMTAYVSQHGPLLSGQGDVEQEIELLEAAGFTVERGAP